MWELKAPREGLAVSIQVNEEVSKGVRADMKTKETLDLIRNYLSPENRQDIAATTQVPDFRKKYLGLYSPGFMKKAMDASYNPSWREFYDDFRYRQTLELLGHQQAWTAKMKDLRPLFWSEINTRGFEVLLPVVNGITCGSLRF